MNKSSFTYGEAISAHTKNRLKIAEGLYRDVLAQEPDHVDAIHNLSVLYIQTGQFKQAHALLDRLITGETEVAQHWITLIQCNVSASDEKSLVTTYKKIMKIKSSIKIEVSKYFFDNVFFREVEPAILQKLKVKIEGKEYASAKESLNKLLAIYPLQLILKDLEMSISYLEGQYQDVLAQFSFFSEHELAYLPSLYKGALAYKEIGSIKDALELFQKILSLDPHHDGSLLQMSVLKIDAAEYETAIGLLENLNTDSEFNTEASYNIALCHFKMGNNAVAKDKAVLVIDTAPEYYPAYQLLGDIVSLDDPLKALQHYDIAKSNNFMNTDLALSLLQIFLKLKKYQAAREFLETLPCKYLDIRVVVSGIVVSQHLKNAEMLAFYNKKKLEYPVLNTAHHKDIAYIYFAIEDHHGAVAHLEEYLKHEPTDTDAIVNLFTTKITLKDFSGSYALFEKYNDLIKSDPIIMAHMGLVYYFHLFDPMASIDCFMVSINNPITEQSAWNNLYFPLRTLLMQAKLSENDFDTLFSNQAIDKVSVLKLRVFEGTEKSENLVDVTHKTLLTHTSDIISYETRNKDLKDDNSRYEDPIALLNFGRSGTGMFHALVDGHPEITTLPSVYFSELFDDRNMLKLLQGGSEKFCTNLKNLYPIFFDSTDISPLYGKGGRPLRDFGFSEGLNNLGRNQDESICIDFDQFTKTFNDLTSNVENMNFKVVFELLNLTYEYLTTGLTNKRKIFYHIHNPDKRAFINFINAYPRAKLCVLVREPLQTIASWLSLTDDYTEMVTRMSKIFFDINEPLYSRVDCVGIRLEDIKRNTDDTLKKICSWLEVDLTPSMYEMTMQGKKWWGDPQSPHYETEGMNPFGTTAIQRSNSIFFSERDTFLLETLFRPFKKKFGYLTIDSNIQADAKRAIEQVDELFHFERNYIIAKKISENELKSYPMYKVLRGSLRMRLKNLLEHGTYSKMLKPLH